MKKALTTALALAAISCSAAASAAKQVPRIYPYNASFWELVDENGREHALSVNPFTGEAAGDGWRAKPGRHGNTTAEHDGNIYSFKNGFLAETIRRDGTKRRFETPDRIEGGVETLFPSLKEQAAGRRGKTIAADIWSDSGRFRAFYGNPNKTAMLFVQLALLAGCGALALAKRRRWKICAVPACAAALAACAAFATGSRGGFVAFGAGAAAVCARRFRTSRKRLAAASAIAAIAIAAGAALSFAPGAERFTGALFKVDESNSLRVNILKAFPRMLHDAPGGWGRGGSGAAYVKWYRPDEEMHLVRALVSSHFTWMAEAGRAGRICCIAAWLVWFAAACAAARRGRRGTLAMAAAMCAGAAFNHVGEEWTLWLAPAAATLWSAAAARGCGWRRMARNAAVICAAAAGAATMCCFALEACGRPDGGEISIRKDGALVFVNEAKKPPQKKTVYIAMDEAATGGWMFAGKELLEYCGTEIGEPAAALTDESLAGLPDEAERIVLTGRACNEYMRRLKAGERVTKAKSVIMVSPACDTLDIPEEIAGAPGFRAIVGSMAAARMKPSEQRPPWLRIVKGAELYIPGWLRIALAPLP